MTPPDPARIAAGLTENCRVALLRFDPVAWATDLCGSDLPDLYPLAKAGLLQSSHNVWMWRLTDLGRAVRAALAASVTDGDA